MKSFNEDITEPLFTLQIASALTRTSVYSIRKYIDKGLLIPFRKKTNRHLFSHLDIIRLKCIRKNLDEQGLNLNGIKALYSQIPCWKIKPCTLQEREECGAYLTSTQPCWEASEKSLQCRNDDCRTCNVYRVPEQTPDIKSLLKKFIQ